MRHAKLSRRGFWPPLVGLCLGLAATGAFGQNRSTAPATCGWCEADPDVPSVIARWRQLGAMRTPTPKARRPLP